LRRVQFAQVRATARPFARCLFYPDLSPGVGCRHTRSKTDKICAWVRIFFKYFWASWLILCGWRWLKQSGLEASDLGHLKRIRKLNEATTLLLNTSPFPPQIPQELHLPAPYRLDVPRTVALTQASLKLKCSLWPTFFAPVRKDEAEPWSRGKVHWARKAFQRVLEEASQAHSEGEVPSVFFFQAKCQD